MIRKSVVFPEPDRRIVFAAHIDLREDIFESCMVAVLIHVVHTTGDVEERDHLFHVGIHYQSMRFTRWFEDVVARSGDPVVLQISP